MCDGENGTHDLLDQFVVCSGDLYADHSTGGSEDVTLASHSHTGVTNTTGNHSHVQSISGLTGGQFGQNPGTANSRGTFRANNIITTSNGAHTHTFTVDNTATEDGIGKNLPPYRSLFYIMKINEGGL